jgi:HNH endonuclease/NUMOD4 motif
MSEIWVPIKGYGDCYSVSNIGRVMRTSPRNIVRLKEKSRAKPFAPSECKSFLNRGGYPQVRIGPTGKQMTVCVHRLVAIAFVPNPDSLLEVNHKDGNKANNDSLNLEWVTRQQNIKHAVRTGLLKVMRGEESARSILTTADIQAIRADTRIAAVIAVDYGTCRGNIYAIKQRRAWKHVP